MFHYVFVSCKLCILWTSSSDCISSVSILTFLIFFYVSKVSCFVIEQKKSLASELVHWKYLVIVLEQIVIFSDYSKLHWRFFLGLCLVFDCHNRAQPCTSRDKLWDNTRWETLHIFPSVLPVTIVHCFLGV
jgi:hypothetical protein